MKKLCLIPLVLTFLLFVSACNRSVTSYVNPFVGTDGHGHTYPGAIVPFGMIQSGPDTRLQGWDGCSAYHYSDDTLYGFSHTHLSGTGVEDYGDILVMPFTIKAETKKEQYCSPFSHKNERAEPGYYSVIIDKSRVLAELTATERTAVHRYSFPRNDTKGIIIDLTHRDMLLDCDIKLDSKSQTITGFRRSSAWNPNQYCYFALTANRPIIDFIVVRDSLTHKNAKAIVYFPDNAKEVELHVAISAVDTKGALENLATDKNLNFDKIRKSAHLTWEKELSKIEVEGGSREDRRNFYTALYHCMTAPYLFSDADGRYRGQDNAIHTVGEELQLRSDSTVLTKPANPLAHKVYTVFSLWDTYRTLHPLLTLIDRQRTEDFVYTFAQHYRQGGELTMWELSAHETHCMIGYHSCPVILDALNAGILDSFGDAFKLQLLQAMVATSNRTPAHKAYGAQGYLSSELDNESVSKTLEYAFDDWCIAQYAKAMPVDTIVCDSLTTTTPAQIYKTYMARAQSWKNILDADGFMHARRNGGFVTPFSPAEVNNHFTEANSWQYSTYVPHDMAHYFSMMGGNAGMERFLDSLFHSSSKLEGREQSDITGLIGQYAHGNEPSHHAAYLYAMLGKQYKTAELVRQICLNLYTSKPDGLCGNEDCGQMSAWFVMSALGFYPVCPGSETFVVGSPLFSKATIHLENGKKIVINGKNQSHKNMYVQSMAVNSKSTRTPLLNAKTLRNGCTIDFIMGPSPNPSFGNQAEGQTAVPEASVTVPCPYFNRWEQRFNDSTLLEIAVNPNYAKTIPTQIYYTTDGSQPDTSSLRYTGPIQVNSDITISAIAYNPQHGYSPVVRQQLTRFIADKKLSYTTPPDPQYRDSGEDGLIDRLFGTTNYRIGGWQGWKGNAEVVIDLLDVKPVHNILVDCLSDCRSWVFFPQGLSVEYSADGQSYQPFGTKTQMADNAMSDPTWNYKENSRQAQFSVSGNAIARYLKIKVQNYGKLPRWHISAGQPAWLFIDEITVQ